VHRPRDPGAPPRPRPREVLRRAVSRGGGARRGGHADRVRGRPGAGEACLDDGLGFRLRRGDDRVHEASGRQRDGHRHDDVDRAGSPPRDRPGPWLALAAPVQAPDRGELGIGHPVRRGRPGWHPQAHRGGGVHAPIAALDQVGDLRGGQQADARPVQAKPGGQLSQVHRRVGPAVPGRHLRVQHPLPCPEPSAEHAAGHHRPSRPGPPQRHGQRPGGRLVLAALSPPQQLYSHGS
jgi:hypothetical protein